MNYTLQRGFRDVFEKNGSIMLLVEPTSGRIVDANPVASAYYGYSRASLVGMSMSQINTLAWREVALERKQAVIAERDSFHFRHRLASGEQRDVEVYFSFIEADSKPLLFSIVHDVTQLKQAREELRASEAFYRTVFQMSLDSVSISRCGDGMFIDVNQSFLETMEYSREEVVGRTSTELDIWINPDDRQRPTQTLRSQLPCRNVEVKLRKKSGEIIWCMMSISQIEMDGAFYLLSVFKNASDVNEAEEDKRPSFL
jgi:PAS domain S-box-containing protein